MEVDKTTYDLNFKMKGPSVAATRANLVTTTDYFLDGEVLTTAADISGQHVDTQIRYINPQQTGDGYVVKFAFGPYRPLGGIVSFRFGWYSKSQHTNYNHPDKFNLTAAFNPQAACELIGNVVVDRYDHGGDYNPLIRVGCHGLLKVLQVDTDITMNLSMTLPFESAGGYQREADVNAMWEFVSSRLLPIEVVSSRLLSSSVDEEFELVGLP